MLLLVVLSLLVLFMLIGTAFLMSSNQYRGAAKEAAKLNRVGNYPTKLLDGAMMRLLRDTENPQSAIRYHSLLRDLYGTDGFEAKVAGATYARQIGGTPADNTPLGATQGQLIDIAVVPATPPAAPPSLDASHVIKLDRDVNGQTQLQPLPLTKGYYNGCLLTITSGPAKGQSARIIDYEYVGNQTAITNLFPPALGAPNNTWRFRVMAFPRSDGSALVADASSPPTLLDLQNATFVVNGRAFNGTGVGYNPLAAAGTPRLSALEAIGIAGTTPTTAIYPEVALTPNSVYFFASDPRPPAFDANVNNDLLGVRYLDPTGKYLPLNPKSVALANRAAQWKYQSFAGLGDTDESYDAADFQNMYLALQTVTPRAQGRVVIKTGSSTATVDVATAFKDTSLASDFLRLDLEDLPLPSFYRPDLENYWFHWLLNKTNWTAFNSLTANDRIKAILQPYQSDGTRSPWVPTDQMAGQITALKRKISLRPLREDHPHFDGSNPNSRTFTLPSNLVNNDGGIGIPYWEAVGPWDVDNDNDGVPDSVWVDLGDPVTQAEDGTLYKPLYAFLVMDMDSRLNVNAHGLESELVRYRKNPNQAPDDANNPTFPPKLAAVETPPGSGTMVPGNNLAGGVKSDLLPRGLGYGPADISLRPALSPTLPTQFPTHVGDPGIYFNQNADDFARIFAGRYGSGIWGRNGSTDVWNAGLAGAQRGDKYVQPGMYYDSNSANTAAFTTDPISAFKSIGYPAALSDYYGTSPVGCAFGTPPDLIGRYGVGLDYAGQPVFEGKADLNQYGDRLLTYDSPYELNLSDPVRRDVPDAGTVSQMMGVVAKKNASPTNANFFIAFNDDAPYATADLERVLRAHDADTGALPDRLWNVVDAFDPVKLVQNQPGVTEVAAQQLFNDPGIRATNAGDAPKLLVAAQQMASISRRLVTTDSYDLPVQSQNMPSWVPDAGPDAVAAAPDDFQTITGHSRAQATIVDLLHYRVFLERRQKDIVANNWTLPLNANKINNQVKPETETIFNTQQLAQQLLAPEVIAGQKMDLNRPFGDGEDNPPIGSPVGNGVVDEPAEAGDPYLDLNGNGQYDDGTNAPKEPYIDADGNGSYTKPIDTLWAGMTASTIGFDYTNGHGEPLHPLEAANAGAPTTATVRNLESESRQLYARQLYCLMLLLVDMNYVAPWETIFTDPTTKVETIEPAIRTWMDTKKAEIVTQLTAKGMPATDAAAHADFVVKRKLTCRMIAQWAINCADARDPDAIMTPFEYDEDPWDGWGCPDGSNNRVNIPLDGDPATDENKAEVLDWKTIRTNGGVKAIVSPPTGPVTAPGPLDQTRGIVWGAERPELLITETLAFHDRRTEDLASNDSNGHDVLNPARPDPNRKPSPDPNLDQRMRPKGSLFVEVYNPNSADGQAPAELYGKVTTGAATGQAGVNLQRLSNFGVDAAGKLSTVATAKFSPVWRLVVVEEGPGYRNKDKVDLIGKRFDAKVKVAARPINATPEFNGAAGGTSPATKAYADAATATTNWRVTQQNPSPPFRPAPLDLDGLFDLNFLPKRAASAAPYQFEVAYPYIEREFYFTTGNSPRYTAADNLRDNKPEGEPVVGSGFKLRIPDRSITYNWALYTPSELPIRTQKFVAGKVVGPSVVDVPIAPILPGRYGVIGSAGSVYNVPDLVGSFTTTIGRDSSQPDGSDSNRNPELTRRIQLKPDADPEAQQLIVGGNGGDPLTSAIGRNNELYSDGVGGAKNITKAAAPNYYYQPCVAVPVVGMNVSEPPWGWSAREYELAELQPEFASGRGAPKYRVTTQHPDGTYVTSQGNPTSFDTPFDEFVPDVETIFSRTGTTPNYRTVHLQRLANPTLPWNPQPLLADGKTANPEYSAALPINPYRTVDTASVDLTVFNGASDGETNYKVPTKEVDEGKVRPWGPTLARFLSQMASPIHPQVWFFKSHERGTWAQMNLLGAVTGTPPGPQRVLWSQEPPLLDLRSTATQIVGTPARNMTMRVDQVPLPVKTSERIRPNHLQMVLEHSLGFGNEAEGMLYGTTTPSSPAPTALALGAPSPAKDAKNNSLASTYPWLAWNNRPFVSAEELLQVPAASSEELMSEYSTIDPTLTAANQLNAYDGSRFDASNNLVKNAQRYKLMHAPFGHLLNMFGASPANANPALSASPADVVRNTATAVPILDAQGNVQAYGAPNFNRILDYVQVPSRFVGTDELLNPDVFVNSAGSPISSPNDPRYSLQPPFNKVSRERDPGRVNLNTVLGRRLNTDPPEIWSEVYDGIMHRFRDDNLRDASNNVLQLGHAGPAFRDVEISRRGYRQVDAANNSVDKVAGNPDTFAFGLSPGFPSFFSNPFRSANAGDLVPLAQMMQYGVDASLLRVHPYGRGTDLKWGVNNFGDIRDAGFGDDLLSYRADTRVPNDVFASRDIMPLFSELRNDPAIDTTRNPYMMYQPMTRLGNLVTEHSNVFAVWVTVGYFEVEKAPDWTTDPVSDPGKVKQLALRQRFGGTNTDTDAATVAARALYDRVYPEGYALGQEVGSDIGNTKRQRGFYIIDRTIPVGFKPGEDLNDDRAIKVRRRIE